jgi:hypothetical protein
VADPVQKWIELAEREKLSHEQLRGRMEDRGYVASTVSRALRQYRQTRRKKKR